MKIKQGISIDLERYRTAWKSEQGFEKKTLAETDIQNFLKKKSKEITRLFKGSLIVDIVIKSIIGISFIFLFFLFYNSLSITVLNTLLIIGIIIAILLQVKILMNIPPVDYSRDNLKNLLENKISFYGKRYFKSLYISALSSSLLFVSGMMYYFYFKYGVVRPLGIEDYLVFSIFKIIAFILAAFAQIKQHNFQILQLERCLAEIEENTLSEQTIRKKKNRRIQLFLTTFLAIIFGFLVLLYITFQFV